MSATVRVAAVGVLATGALLLVTTVSLLFVVFDLRQETLKNREVGCISRYLDGQQYSPDCEPIIEEYIEGR